jgi:general secretion pathway protein D
MGGGMYGGGMGMMGGGMDYNREYREFNLTRLIQDTIEPDSWFETGTGEGTITTYEGKKLIILQTPEIHDEIEKLLKEMRKSLGHEVSIEARFLIVGENFLQDIGLDVDFIVNPGGNWTELRVSQGSSQFVEPTGTSVPGSLGGAVTGADATIGYGNRLDDLQVSLVLRAVQAQSDSKSLTAPKVTVLSGEWASMQVNTDTVIALPPTIGSDVTTAGVSGAVTTQSLIPQFDIMQTGATLMVNPIITPDKKHVLLNINTFLNDFLGLKKYTIEIPNFNTTSGETDIFTYEQALPETQQSQVSTRVSVPDGGTLLLGGMKLTVHEEREAGVPVMSKLPLIGRLFANRSEIRDTRLLLILVKPTIILQEERDTEAIAAMETAY